MVERYEERMGRNVGAGRKWAPSGQAFRYYVVLALWKMSVLLEAHWARHVRGTAGVFDFSYLEEGGPVLAAYIREVAEE